MIYTKEGVILEWILITYMNMDIYEDILYNGAGSSDLPRFFRIHL
jgi:hypothetical protein